MVAKEHSKQLKRIKNNVEKWVSYFGDNNKRFHEFRKFVFKTQLSEDDLSLLRELQKPQLEFNILNAYISRLCGEFSKQEPSISVMSDYGQPVDPLMIKVVEGHIRHVLCDSGNSTQYDAYRDILSGGFSVLKVWTEYAHDRTFDQVIKFGRVFEPTMCGFDPLAREPHKGDGQYCFEYYPRTKEKFKEEFPKVDISEIDFTRMSEDFNWAYQNDKEDILVVCDYYEKKRKEKVLLKLANGAMLLEDEYEEHIARWTEQKYIEQPPAIVKKRKTMVETICRYRFIGNQVLDYKETDFSYLPYIFVDGDSAMIKDSDNTSYQQFTKPYIYHARGSQQLKNFAGQTLAAEIENMVQHKFMIAEQALPTQEDYLDAYTNIQQANVLVYNAFANDDPNYPVNPPQTVQRVQTPPEVTNAFSLTDSNVQMILGSYDAALGINNNQLSGIAIVEGATQSNSAAMPYIVNYMHAMNWVAIQIMDLLPKYVVTPRSLPVQGMEGKKGYMLVNQPGAPQIHYDSKALNVRVEAGVNFAVQKNRALMQMTEMMHNSPLFAEFMNTEGLDILLDNMEFRNVDIVKQRAEQWMKQVKEMQAKQAQQPNPEMIKAMTEQAKVQQTQKKMDVDAIFKEKEVENEQMRLQNERMNIMMKAGESKTKMMSTMIQANAENKKTAAELHMAARKQRHDEIIDHHKVAIEHKKIDKASKQPKGKK